MKLSAIIIARNEEENIGRALKSVAFADETIVVDSGSTDATVQISKAHGAQVLSQAWQGYGAQKNFGAGAAHGEWLLFIDADEEVPPGLRQAIEAAIAQPATDFYWLRIVTVFLNKPLRHLYGHNPRLFRRRVGSWTSLPVHEQVQAADGYVLKLGDSRSRVIVEPLLHYSHRTVRSHIQRMHHYTTLDAQQMHSSGRHRSGRLVRPSPSLPWQLAGRQFIKLMLYRRGILDGWAGVMWCLLSSYYEYEMGRKFLTLAKQS